MMGLTACERRLPESMGPHVAMVDSALNHLLALPKADDNWVIFTDQKSELFVQFEVIDGGLVIDVPLVNRTDEQIHSLAKVFGREGVKQPVPASGKDPKTREKISIRTYRTSFGADSSRAAVFALRVFCDAYRLSSLELQIESNEANKSAHSSQSPEG